MELTSGLQRLQWDPDLGGRLVSWRVGDLELLPRRSDDPIEFGMYPMAPWAGRVRDNRISVEDLHRMGLRGDERVALPINYPPWALHGTCFTAPVDSMVTSGDTVVSRQVIAQWPWSAELVCTWHIRDDGIDITMTVRADEPTPVILGWHPWFGKSLSGSHVQWSAASARMSVRVDSLPSEQWVDLSDLSGPFDDVFNCPDQRVELTWPGVMELIVDSSHPWFVVFDGQPDAICVEPQTQMPNAWHSPIGGESDLAGPGSDVTLATQWRWTLSGTRTWLSTCSRD